MVVGNIHGVVVEEVKSLRTIYIGSKLFCICLNFYLGIDMIVCPNCGEDCGDFKCPKCGNEINIPNPLINLL